MDHSLDASSGDMKVQRIPKAQSSGKHRVITWWKATMQRYVHCKIGQPDPSPAPVYVTAADVMKTPRETVPPSDAQYHWRM